MLLRSVAAASICGIWAWASSVAAQVPPRLTVMTYNVENFFDAEDDPRMPNGDGAEVINSPEWVAAKAAAIAQVIQRFDYGKGPDVLILTEVESQAALEAIRARLTNGNTTYPTAVLTDADPNRSDPKPDLRGIKVAVLSKLPLAPIAKPRTHAVDLRKHTECRARSGAPGTTRDILQVDVVLPDSQVMTVFGAHMPSGGNPRICREVAAATLEKIAARLPSDRVVIAAGDFNFNCAEDEQRGLILALKEWILPPALDNKCRGNGSQYYWKDKSWSWLDVITQRPARDGDTWGIDIKSLRLVLTDQEQFQWDERDQVMRPKAFRFNKDTGKGSGTSDHWPIAIDLVPRAADREI